MPNEVAPHGPARKAAPPRRLSLRSNFSWTLAGNVVYAGCQWGMLVVLAKVGSPEMVGRFALGLAVCAPVLMFTNLQLRAVQATDAKDEYRFSDYLKLRLIATALALAIIAGIVLVTGPPREAAWVIMVVGIAKSMESVSDVIYGLLQKHERMDRIAISMMIKGVGSLLALGALVVMTGSLVYGAAGLAGTWTALLLTYDVGSAARILRLSNVSRLGALSQAWRSSGSWARLGRLAWLSLPLGVVMMLVSLNVNIPRYFVQHYHGARALGYFSAMAYLMVAGSTVVRALGQSAAPRLARYYVDDVAAFKRLLWRLVAIGLVFGGAGVIVAALFGRDILAVLYRRDYAAHHQVFVWLMVAAGVGYVASLLGYSMTAARYLKAQAPLFAAIGAATAGGCAWLVPARGLMGAAWAMCAAAVAQLLGCVAINVHAVRSRAGRGNEDHA